MSEKEQVPKLVHLTWKSKRSLPPRMRANLLRWRELMPAWRVQLYDDADLERLVDKYCPQHRAAYRSFAAQIERVDFARAAMLGTHGGVYADLDVRPMRAFDDWCDVPEDVLLCVEPPEHYYHGQGLISNAVMLSKHSAAARRFWDGYLEFMARNYQPAAGAINNTGPGALARYVSTLQRAGELPCKLRVLGPCEFNAQLDVAVKPELPPYSDGCDPERAYAFHEWHHTWTDAASSGDGSPSAARWAGSAGWVLGLFLVLISIAWLVARRRR